MHLITHQIVMNIIQTNHIVKFVHANVFENTIKSNVVDITSHDIITLSDKNIQDGINEISC